MHPLLMLNIGSFTFLAEVTNSTDENPSWEAHIAASASLPCILWHPVVHGHINLDSIYSGPV